FAAGFNVPSVVLFGATDPQWSWNYHPQEVVVQQQLPCSPCSKRVCPLKHHQCMRTLTPEKVSYVVQHRWGHALNCRVA
ncbi:MAG: glycosyltransferase family 9 protein, partial [Pirellulaceae bacterium]